MIVGDNELIATNDGKKIILIVTKGEKTVLTALNFQEFIQLQNMLYDQYTDIADKWRIEDAA